jgi:hypothetical protein
MTNKSTNGSNRKISILLRPNSRTNFFGNIFLCTTPRMLWRFFHSYEFLDEMRETREREKREEDAELLSVYVTQKACAHAHNFVRSATKSALTAVLPLRSGRSASRLAQLVRSGLPLSFFFCQTTLFKNCCSPPFL